MCGYLYMLAVGGRTACRGESMMMRLLAALSIAHICKFVFIHACPYVGMCVYVVNAWVGQVMLPLG